jgi:hypothetical protein
MQQPCVSSLYVRWCRTRFGFIADSSVPAILMLRVHLRELRERHYAGWAADRDEAILRANELYEGRDSIEAALVIGNGPTEVEVVYRVDGEN